MLRYLIIALSVLLLSHGAMAQDTPTPFAETIGEAKASMMSAPKAAYDLAVEAEALATEADGATAAITAQWLQGEALARTNQLDEAVTVLDGALEAIETVEPGSKLHADLQRGRATIASLLGDYASAITNFQSAYDMYLEAGDNRSQAMALLNIANIHADARSYDKAISYYELAGEAYSDDPQIDLTRLNNLGTAHRELENFSAAETEFTAALAIAIEMDSAFLRSRILTNVAAVQLDQGKFDLANESLQEGLALEAGQSSGWEPFLHAMEAKLAFAQGDTRSAKQLMDRTFKGVDLATSPVPFLEFHESAAEIYRAAGQPSLALKHLAAFKRLDDEMRDISAAANTALLGAEFDFANQELQISRLRTETLEQEVAIEKAQARQRMLFFVGIAVVLVLLLSGGTIHYLSMRRSRNEVREANSKLGESNVALAKALKSKSDFLATTSHEIRTPLNAILGMSQLLVGNRDLSEDARERAELVHASGLDMKAVVDDILDMSKLESGKVTVQLAECEVADTLDAMTRVWKDRAAEKNIEIVGALDTCPVTAVTDERKLRQIMLNLMSNAVKFTEAGEIKVETVFQPSEAGDVLSISIKDTGCGIPEDHLKAIFEPFQQVDNSNTRQHSGTGLGLAISLQLAEAMGGTITLESRVGVGSVFTLRLPVTDAKLGTAGQTGSTERVDILLIEPNPLRQSILEAMLEDGDEAIRFVDDLTEGQAILAKAAPQTVYIPVEALGDELGDIMDAMAELSDCAKDATILVWMGDEVPVEAPMLKLSGADTVIEGEFDAFAISVALSGDTSPTSLTAA